MSILKVSNLSLQYGDKVLYDQQSFEINRGEHVGLVGENGQGKTTLLDVILGKTHADDGKVDWEEKVKFGYLDQHAQVDLEQTILKYLQSAFSELFEINERLEKNLQELEKNYSEKVLTKVLRDQEVLAEHNFDGLEAKIKRLASGIGVTQLGMERQLKTLSGGQRAKVMLCKLFLDEPQMLILDEPTNFLDREHVSWLADFLKNYPNAFLLVSHDTAFLDSVTTHILYLKSGQLKKYRGNYTAFLYQKEEQESTLIKSVGKQQKEIEKLKDYIARNSARTSTARQAQSRAKKLNKMEVLAPPEQAIKPHFAFSEKAGPIGNVLLVKNLDVGYEKPLLKNLNFEIRNGKKVAIVGFNGIGKSTLIKTLLSEIKKINGEIKWANDLDIGYFEQELNWVNPYANSLEIVGEKYRDFSDNEIRAILGKFGIKKTKVSQPIGSLSGGEQAKVKLAMLALTKHNFLILDEPTNHLDVLAKEALREAIKKFVGTVILVSHEEEFYRDFVSGVISLE